MLQVLREGEVVRASAAAPAGRAPRPLRATAWRSGRKTPSGRSGTRPARARQPLRREVFDGDAELQQLGLVAIQLPLGGELVAAVLVGKDRAQVGERDGLARIEQERDDSSRRSVLSTGARRSRRGGGRGLVALECPLDAATLSPGISISCRPADRPRCRMTKKLSPSLSIRWMPGPIWMT